MFRNSESLLEALLSADSLGFKAMQSICGRNVDIFLMQASLMGLQNLTAVKIKAVVF